MNISIVSAYDEYGETDYLLGKAADSIAKQRDLGITSDRVLQFVAMLEDQVVGGAWVSFDGDNYEFDVAVAPGYDRKGIGTKLVQAAVSERSEVCQGYDEAEDQATMLVPVTSRSMCRLLEKEGFVITDVPAKGFFTMGLKEECEPYKKAHPDTSHLPYVWLALCQPKHSHEGLTNRAAGRISGRKAVPDVTFWEIAALHIQDCLM